MRKLKTLNSERTYLKVNKTLQFSFFYFLADKNAAENAKPIAAEEPRALSPTPAGGQVSAEELTGAEEQQTEDAPAQEAQGNISKSSLYKKNSRKRRGSSS